MDLRFTPEEEAFRLEIRAWVRDNLPKDISDKVHRSIRLTKADLQRWAQILGAKGWLGWGWPKEHGGPGWNSIQKHLPADATQEDVEQLRAAFGGGQPVHQPRPPGPAGRYARDHLSAAGT